MYDSSKLLANFHDAHVALSGQLQKDMRGRREANIDRLLSGLADNNKPTIVDTINQGGYAMKTMTQPPEGDEDSRYDIDMGVVFEAGETKTPLTTKNWVRDAIAAKASSMKNDPQTKPKCVRVTYSDGYQVDFPVFKRQENQNGYETFLATNDDWILSSPQQFNSWFEDRVSTLSPESNPVYQLRKIVRLFKYFAKVEAYKKGTKFPAGLVATALAVECYFPVDGRLDKSFYETLKRMSVRSKNAAVVADSVVISDEKDVDRIERLRCAAQIAIEYLEPLFSSSEEQSENDVRSKWKRVFRHSYFDAVAGKASEGNLNTKSAAGLGISTGVPTPAVAASSEKPDLLSAAVEEVKKSSGGMKPWSSRKIV